MAGLHPVVVISGATGAIGSATAALLARRGARLLLLSRPSDRLDALVTRLDTDDRVTSVEVDLSSNASVRAAARQISRQVAHVDALINTAAVFASEYEQSDDGIELMLATNHLGPFLLTNLLRDKMAGGSRVITVTAPRRSIRRSQRWTSTPNASCGSVLRRSWSWATRAAETSTPPLRPFTPSSQPRRRMRGIKPLVTKE